MSIIPAKDVGKMIWEDLQAIAVETLPDATEGERQEAIAQFLGAWGGAMFKGPVTKKGKNK